MRKLGILLAAACLTVSSVALAEDVAPSNNTTAPAANTATANNVQPVSQKASKRSVNREKKRRQKRCNCGQ